MWGINRGEICVNSKAEVSPIFETTTSVKMMYLYPESIKRLAATPDSALIHNREKLLISNDELLYLSTTINKKAH